MRTTLKTTDGLTLGLRHWPCAPARGSVLLVHGLGEHIGRYAHVARRLNAWGWNVVGYDQRGHGASEGERGRLASDDALLRDLGLVIDAVRGTSLGPLVLLGHSLGGLVAARFVAEGIGHAARRGWVTEEAGAAAAGDFMTVASGAAAAPPPAPAAPFASAAGSSSAAPWHRAVDALVLSSPALDIGIGSARRLLVRVLSRLVPDLGLGNGLDPHWISRAPEVVVAYRADPLVHDRIAPRLARFIVDGGELVRARASRWSVPTLLLYAGSDRCVAPRGSAAFAAAAPAGIVTAREFGALFHEIFNEPEQEQVLAALQDWLATRG